MSSSADAPVPSLSEITQQLDELERSLLALKERVTSIQTNTALQQSLQSRLDELQAESRQSPSKTLQTEIRHLAKQIEEIELTLESQYFPWQGLKEAFWQSVRFVGLGIVIGWALKSWAG